MLSGSTILLFNDELREYRKMAVTFLLQKAVATAPGK
jgi:hypothetical protein